MFIKNQGLIPLNFFLGRVELNPFTAFKFVSPEFNITGSGIDLIFTQNKESSGLILDFSGEIHCQEKSGPFVLTGM